MLGTWTAKGLTAAERVNEIVRSKRGSIAKKVIVEICPDLSDGTIECALTELVKSGRILKIGGGSGTEYVYNHEKRCTK